MGQLRSATSACTPPCTSSPCVMDAVWSASTLLTAYLTKESETSEPEAAHT